MGGCIALVAAIAAVIWANIDAAGYAHVQHTKVGPLNVEHWTADGGLTLFFFVAGLELKREFVHGALLDRRAAAIPVTAAFCGVAVPALVFVLINLGGPNLRGWAIPSPTDIAFALAVLAVLGSRIPRGIRLFLLTLAVVDDLIVIAIIAVAYSGTLDWAWLALAVACLAAYGALSRFGRGPLVIVALIALGVLAWWSTLHSGIHATVAGVALALLTPTDVGERLEHLLAPWSAGLIVPAFALTSAGINLGHANIATTTFWGVFAGLVLGKPLGIALGAWLAARATKTTIGMRASELLGLGFLGGIGFTVALLVSDLAFSDDRLIEAKSAVLMASTAAALLGVAVLVGSARRSVSERVGRRQGASDVTP